MNTYDGHSRLYERLWKFFGYYPESVINAAVENTGGYENNWFNSLIKFQGTLNLRTARLNPLGVSANSKADLKSNIITRSVHKMLLSTSGEGIVSRGRPSGEFKKAMGFYTNAD